MRVYVTKYQASFLYVQLGDENSERLAMRFNSSFNTAFAVLTFLLPGTPIVYCGDELGATSTGGASNAWSREQPSRAIFPWPANDFCVNNCTAWTYDSTSQVKTTTYAPVYGGLHPFPLRNNLIYLNLELFKSFCPTQDFSEKVLTKTD